MRILNFKSYRDIRFHCTSEICHLSAKISKGPMFDWTGYLDF